jgi:hypothetical protein
MEIVLEIPDDIVPGLKKAGNDLSRGASRLSPCDL